LSGSQPKAPGFAGGYLPTSIGGSDAQDDLFRQAYLRSLQAARREAEATAYLKTMTANKHRTRLDRLLAN
jgi:hypothetical protein